MNVVILRGNLTRDPEIRVVETNGKKTSVANFTVAVSRFFKKANGETDKDTTFVSCEAWDTGAETIGKLFVKGDPILVRGSLRSDSWEKDGVKRSTLKMRVDEFEKLNRPPARPSSDNDSELVAANAISATQPDSDDGEKVPF